MLNARLPECHTKIKIDGRCYLQRSQCYWCAEYGLKYAVELHTMIYPTALETSEKKQLQ